MISQLFSLPSTLNVIRRIEERVARDKYVSTSELNGILREDPSYTVTNAEGGHRSTAFCSLGRMCMELSRGKKEGFLKWDAANEVTGNAEADRMLKPFARGKFDLRVPLKAAGLDYDKMVKPLCSRGCKA